MSTAQKDRVAGALLGMAAGDALGAPYEFGLGTSDPRMTGGRGWEPGEWTDDTQMALCIARVTATGSRDLAAIGDCFLEWYRSPPKDVGLQTGRVLARASSGGELADIAAQDFARNPHGAAGNGSLMRTAPVALAQLGNDAAIAELAMQVSDLTHGDPLAGEACVLWCIAIDRAIHLERLDGVWDGLELLASKRRDYWRGILEEAESRPPHTFSPNGFVIPALQAAYASVKQTPIADEQPCRHLQDALRTATSIGDDTDTVAAIAGALLGARWGGSAVPLEWRRLLHGWPGYAARDLMRVAVLSADRGKNDDWGWPEAPNLLERYAERRPTRGVVKPLVSDEGVLVGDLDGLQGRGGITDVVVSLCRMGTEDVAAPEHHEIWLIDKEPESENPNLDFILRDTASFIAARRSEGKTVFLHCVRAESRTPAVAAAYLVVRGLGPHEALAEVHDVLPRSRLNTTFERAIRSFA